MLTNQEFAKYYRVPANIKSIDVEEFAMFTLLLKRRKGKGGNGELWRVHRTNKQTLADMRKQTQLEQERERQELLSRYIQNRGPFGGNFQNPLPRKKIVFKD